MWVKIAGPFQSIEEATSFRDSGNLKHETNTSGKWACARGGNARRRMSKCAHATHGDCPVRLCVCMPRAGETGVNILIDTTGKHTPDQHQLPAWDTRDPIEARAQGVVCGVMDDRRRPPKMSMEKRAFALNFWRQMPSATPREVYRAFQVEAQKWGAPLRNGRGTGYAGATTTSGLYASYHVVLLYIQHLLTQVTLFP